MQGESAPERRVFEIAGADRVEFLQGLVTNDMGRLKPGNPVYAALLTPQGKYLADFLLIEMGETIALDVHEDLAESLLRMLNMYRLRADVQIAASSLKVQRGLGTPPSNAVPDPRHPALGWRLYSLEAGSAPEIDWDAIRVDACIPESGIELVPGETFILEAGFERLGGVDHRKGCYVGQEVTARMKHKTELRKGLETVSVEGAAPVGTEITAEGRRVGKLFTQSGGAGIAYLRFDKAQGVMQAGEATLHRRDAAA